VLNWRNQCEEKPPAVNRDWLQRHSPAFQAGLLIGLVHMLFILANVIGMIRYHEGQWNMFWIVCGYLDFPVSLLLSRVILPVIGFDPHLSNPYLAGARGPMFAIFLLFHTIIGSAWYFALPALVQKATERITTTTTGALAAAAMIIIPIPIHWLQLLRFFGRDTAPTAIGLNCILPGLWMVLFAWILLTNARRKVMLWLLCLVPPVFYYLVKDLYYYYVMLARH
jgi:hypothetical protein